MCPTGALTETLHISKVINAINDKEKIVTIQHAPAISITLAEELGLKPTPDLSSKLA